VSQSTTQRKNDQKLYWHEHAIAIRTIWEARGWGFDEFHAALSRSPWQEEQVPVGLTHATSVWLGRVPLMVGELARLAHYPDRSTSDHELRDELLDASADLQGLFGSKG
jgi:hypothetical protein